MKNERPRQSALSNDSWERSTVGKMLQQCILAIALVAFAIGIPFLSGCKPDIGMTPVPTASPDPFSALSYTISTLAGGSVGDGGAATSAQLNHPHGVAVDVSGNLYIVDTDNQRIRKVLTNGTITTVAGNGISGYSGDGGAATSAQLTNPSGVAVDASGNLYIADYMNNRIRKVALDGTITTVAGNGTSGFSGDGGAATDAQLNHPHGVAVDVSGNLYIVDKDNDRIRKVAANGTITTVAGNGSQGYSGDGGAATDAQLNQPSGVAVDSSGNLYIADYMNNRIRKVALDGTITTVAQRFEPINIAVDASGNLYIVDWGYPQILKVTLDGTTTTVAGNGTQGYSGDGGAATGAQLNTPNSVAVDASGNLYIADCFIHRIRKVVAADGTIITVAGSDAIGGVVDGAYSGDGGAATSAQLAEPSGVALDASGNLYFIDWGNRRIRKISIDGTITTVAGNGTLGYSGDGGAATSAQLASPSGIAVDISGNLYISDIDNQRIRKVSVDGIITTVAGSGAIGFGRGGYSGDGGAATSAQLFDPSGIALDASGNLYIADRDNHRIRKVDHVTGIISTVAGTGIPSFSGDGGPATSAQLTTPNGVVVDASGNLYILDEGNLRIRKVTKDGIITTVAGCGANYVDGDYAGDGGAAISAKFNFLPGIAVDTAGNLYILDNPKGIRKVSTNGIITTVAKNGTSGYSGDSPIAGPNGLVVDASGNLYVANLSNHRILKLKPKF